MISTLAPSSKIGAVSERIIPRLLVLASRCGPDGLFGGEEMKRKCSIKGCKKLGDDKDRMCGMHAQRVRRYGDPHYITPEKQMRANNRIAQIRSHPAKPSSYLKFHGRHEHRVVVEEILGRKLLPGEIIHHKDGDKHNNAPENLEVTTRVKHIEWHRDVIRIASAKLTLEEVREIRKSKERTKALAEFFDVSTQTIYRIRAGKSWVDIK